MLSPRGVVAAIALLHLAIGFLGFSSRSPFALELADAVAGAGDLKEALERYDAIGANHWSPRVREEALWRAGMILSVDLRDPEAARARFRRVTLMDGASREADAYEQIGRLLQDVERRPEVAAESFADAARAAPDSPRAPVRLAKAAAAWAEAGETAQAEALWAALARDHRDWRVRSLLARADLRLAEDDTSRALWLYRRAQELAEGDDATVARLGAAACLERLGSLDEALAELDAAALPADVHAARTGGLRARLDAGDW